MGEPNHPVVRRNVNVIRDPPRQWFVDYLPVTGNNQIELLVDGDAYGKALHAALMGASSEVMLTGLHFQPTYRLLRGNGHDLTPNHPATLLNTLRKVAAKGVTIYLLVNQFWVDEWKVADPIRKKIKKEGHIDWYLPETSALFVGLKDFPNVHCRTDVHPGFVMGTHHQKTVIIDKKVAFVGGIDLTLVDGDRWDNPEHKIPAAPPVGLAADSDGLKSYGPQDNRCYSLPEHFWHDVQCKVQGPSVDFVIDNFHARWNHGRLFKNMAYKEKMRTRYVSGPMGMAHPYKYLDKYYEAEKDDKERHMFPRMDLGKHTYQDRMRNKKSIHLRDYADKEPPPQVEKSGIDSVPKLPGTKIQVVRSMPSSQYVKGKQKPDWDLCDKKWERSCKDAYLIAIRAAREYIYLENQWISDEHIWAELKASMRRNQDNPDFRIVIMLPRRPLAAAGYGSDQDIDLRPHVKGVMAETKSVDQFGMYCAVAPLPATRRDNIALSGADKKEFGPDSAQIYIHSKVLIVDDCWSLIGSANAGGISLLGVFDPRKMFTTGTGSVPDTELSVAVYDKAFGKKFRETLWKEHLESTSIPGAVPAAADMFRDKMANPKSRVQAAVLFAEQNKKGGEATRRIPPYVMAKMREHSTIDASKAGPVSLRPDSGVSFTCSAFNPGPLYTLHYRWVFEDQTGKRWYLRALTTDRVVHKYGPEHIAYIPSKTAAALRRAFPGGGSGKMICRVLVTPKGLKPKASSAHDRDYGVVLQLPIKFTP